MRKADQYDNPKQIKMFSVSTISEHSIEVLAVTYMRTCIMGIQKKFSTLDDVDAFVKTLEEHEHDRGVILEVGRLG